MNFAPGESKLRKWGDSPPEWVTSSVSLKASLHQPCRPQSKKPTKVRGGLIRSVNWIGWLVNSPGHRVNLDSWLVAQRRCRQRSCWLADGLKKKKKNEGKKKSFYLMTPVGNYGPNPLSESQRPWTSAWGQRQRSPISDARQYAARREVICPPSTVRLTMARTAHIPDQDITKTREDPDQPRPGLYITEKHVASIGVVITKKKKKFTLKFNSSITFQWRITFIKNLLLCQLLYLLKKINAQVPRK